MFFGKNKENLTVLETELKEEGIYLLGLGNQQYRTLEKNLKEALEKLNLKDKINHISNFRIISGFDEIKTTPALVIDNKVVSHGKILTVDECLEILKKR